MNLKIITPEFYHVRSRAPLRIGLAGGGTDIKDYYELYQGATLNVTLRKYHQ